MIEQNSEFCFSFLFVAVPGFFLILPWSHKVTLLQQSSCTLSKGGLCLHLQLVEVKGEQRQTDNHVRLPWMDWEKLQPIQSWLMQCDFATHSVVCGSGLMTCQLKPISHEKRGEASQGRKPICPYTAMWTLQAAEGPQPCIRSNSDSAGPFGSLVFSLIHSSFH